MVPLLGTKAFNLVPEDHLVVDSGLRHQVLVAHVWVVPKRPPFCYFSGGTWKNASIFFYANVLKLTAPFREIVVLVTERICAAASISRC